MTTPKKPQCKWCEKEGIVHFGWLDSKSIWHSEHYTCTAHAILSMNQQQFEMEMEQLRERCRIFDKKPFCLLHYSSNP